MLDAFDKIVVDHRFSNVRVRAETIASQHMPPLAQRCGYHRRDRFQIRVGLYPSQHLQPIDFGQPQVKKHRHRVTAHVRLVDSRIIKITQHVLAISHHDKLAGAALVGTTSRGESHKGLLDIVRIFFKNIFSKKQEHRRGRPLLYFEVCATRSERRLPCLPTFRPDTAPKAVTDATHVGERCIEDLSTASSL